MTTTIADVFDVSPRFLRSVNLERDFSDPSVIRSYVVTPQAKAHLSRLADGLVKTSTQRAWRITGDYGTGKSSFALAMAHVLSGRSAQNTDLPNLVDFRKLGLRQRPELLPILVTGSREPMTVVLLRSLRRALEGICSRGSQPSILKRLTSMCERAALKVPTDDELLGVLEEVSAYARLSKKASGLLVVIDELGKFLEFAALHPGQQDIYLLQRLAEAAARSGDNQLFVVGILHQGFNAYAEHLSPAAQREWEKVAGRFEELLFTQPLEQTAFLVAQALGVRERSLPKAVADAASSSMQQTVSAGWYGPGASASVLRATASRMYPLHPSVVPVVVRLFSRFGQNERSLFSFLFSNEPFGLMSFADRAVSTENWYQLHNLYDYARGTFGYRLGIQSYRSHWNQIESLVSSFATSDELELRVLKSVAILNLLDEDWLLATEDTLCLALACDESPPEGVRAAIATLKARKVLYNRGAAGGFCLWPHTSVNLDRAYEAAKSAVGTPHRVAALLADQLDTRPLVARRHYIETGNLRYFEIDYRAVADVAEPPTVGKDTPDGQIIVFLCETPEERLQALKDATGPVLRQPNVLIAVPKPLQGLAGLVQEVHRWRWIAHNTPELNHDNYAAAEVSRQIHAAERVLETRLQALLGLRQFGSGTELQWYGKGRPLSISGGRALLSHLSDICDEVYCDAPKIKNELVNRRQLSSAAAAARMRLIERAFSNPASPFLGMDPVKTPPEMSVYLSVLEASGLHRKLGGSFRFADPPPADPCNLRPSLSRMLERLKDRQEARVSVSDLLGEIYRPPYGIREGIAHLLLTAFIQIHDNELAFYEGGVFVRQLGAAEMHRLLKAPDTFAVQYCRVAGVRGALFEHLIRVLLPDRADDRKADVLDIVRPLCVFAAQLPQYAQKTLRVDRVAQAVRAALISAKEPAPLLFTDLPKACGFEPFATTGGGAERERAVEFVTTLKNAIDALKAAYPCLLDEVRTLLASAFERPGDPRAELRAAAEPLTIAVSDPTLRALCLRLADAKLAESEWLESIGSLVCEKPPAKWLDSDVDRFREQLENLAKRFRRVESLQFPGALTPTSSAMRLAITRPDGSEVDRVLQITAHEEQAANELEAALVPLLRRHGDRVALVAVARTVWKELSRHDDETTN